jgi:ribosomal-protein-alanine N-acetyltransferase
MLQVPEWAGNRLLIDHQKYPNPESLVGVLWSKQIFEDKVRIVALVIEEQYQGQGLGTKMIYELFSIARELEKNTIQLEVRVSNVRAQKFYQRFGLNIHQTIANYYADEDGYMMVGTV